MKKHAVYLSLGTNLGNRLDNLKHALESMKEFCQVVASSSVYETDPWGFEDQPFFYNQVVKIETVLDPIQLLREIKKMELEMGRIPTFQYGPRLIDIDILLYEDLIIVEENLKIPHPLLQERRFVLVPLCEIAAELLHPVLKKTFEELLEVCEDKGVVKKYR